MHLTSSLEPTGPKSKDHYLVLRHEGNRELIKLPESYSDLQNVVKNLYHLKPDEFHIETTELNLCVGERIKVPEGLWGDVAKLLGNIYVVPRAIDAHPESGPEPVTLSNPAQITNQGVINLEAPFVKDELVVIKIGTIDFQAYSSETTHFNVQLLDKNKKSSLSLSIFPSTGITVLVTAVNETSTSRSLKDSFSLTKDHSIIILKQASSFQVLFDLRFIGAIEAPSHSPITSIEYNLGIPAVFQGPITANVYSGLSHFRQNNALHGKMAPPLYQQIMNGDTRDAARISEALSVVRNDRSSYRKSGLNCQVQSLTHQTWTNLEWCRDDTSFYVVRYTLRSASSAVYIHFGGGGQWTLRVGMSSGRTGNSATFSEHDGSSNIEDYHTITLTDTMLSPKEHSVAFFNQGGKIRVMFDFKQSIVLPRTTMIGKVQQGINVACSSGTIVGDLYTFSP